MQKKSNDQRRYEALNKYFVSRMEKSMPQMYAAVGIAIMDSVEGIDQFAITEDGYLILIDDCDNLVYCPNGRFTAIVEQEGVKNECKDIQL